MDCGRTEEGRRKESAAKVSFRATPEIPRGVAQHYSSAFFILDFAALSMRTGEPALLPEFLPHPDFVAGLDWITQLMSEHANLPAVMDVVHDHVSEHGSSARPTTRPPVAVEVRNPPFSGQSVGEHLGATLGALCEGNFRLARSAAGAVKFGGKLDVRCRKPEPFAARMVHMRKDRRNGAHVSARWFGAPSAWIETIENDLVHAVVDFVSF